MGCCRRGYDGGKDAGPVARHEELAMTKSEVIALVHDQPEELDIDKFIYTLYMRRQIELGLTTADGSDVISREEFETMMAPQGLPMPE